MDKAWKRALLLLLCVTCLVCTGNSFTAAATPTYRHVRTDSMRIALTFDDGPHPTQTQRILDILDRYEVRATFFMIGSNVEYYPKVARDVIGRGHEVGNHTYSHRRLSKLEVSDLSEELHLCETALERLCDYHPTLFRPPEGYLNDGVLRCSETGDYSLILWSIDTRDWETKETDHIVDTVLREIKPGDIVLMHDYVAKSKTPEALEILLPKLLALGYEPVTVSELIGIG